MQEIIVLCDRNTTLSKQELNVEIDTLVKYIIRSFQKGYIEEISFVQYGKKPLELVAIPSPNFKIDKINNAHDVMVNVLMV